MEGIDEDVDEELAIMAGLYVWPDPLLILKKAWYSGIQVFPASWHSFRFLSSECLLSQAPVWRVLQTDHCASRLDSILRVSLR